MMSHHCSTAVQWWHWNIWVNFPRAGKMVKMWHLSIFWSSAVTRRFDFFQLFSTDLKKFCPLDSRYVFVLVLAHLESELVLFEVDDVVMMICSTIISQTSNSSNLGSR